MSKKKIVIYMDNEDFRAYSDLVLRDNINNPQSTPSKGPYANLILQEWIQFREDMREAGVEDISIKDIIDHARKDISWIEQMV